MSCRGAELDLGLFILLFFHSPTCFTLTCPRPSVRPAATAIACSPLPTRLPHQVSRQNKNCETLSKESGRQAESWRQGLYPTNKQPWARDFPRTSSQRKRPAHVPRKSLGGHWARQPATAFVGQCGIAGDISLPASQKGYCRAEKGAVKGRQNDPRAGTPSL